MTTTSRRISGRMTAVLTAGVVALAGVPAASIAANAAGEATTQSTTAEVVYVASGVEFADALGGSALASATDAPILLTKPTVLPKATKAALETLNPSKIVVFGGTSAVSATVLAELKTYAAVERVAGEDRYDTAAKVAAKAAAAAPVETEPAPQPQPEPTPEPAPEPSSPSDYRRKYGESSDGQTPGSQLAFNACRLSFRAGDGYPGHKGYANHICAGVERTHVTPDGDLAVVMESGDHLSNWATVTNKLAARGLIVGIEDNGRDPRVSVYDTEAGRKLDLNKDADRMRMEGGFITIGAVYNPNR